MQRRALQTVDAILDAVLRILKREGTAAVTTNRIAEVAGVSIGSLYQYFPDKDAIFHTVFDLDDRYQVPGAQFLQSGHVYEKNEREGSPAHWRGIYDDHGRLMVAICHNMDLGDSWENADDPRYPEKFSALGIRIGIDYLIYAMTH